MEFDKSRSKYAHFKTLDDNVTNLTCLLDNGRYYGYAKYGLGDLDKLALELQSSILVQLDLRTLTDFRRVNRRATKVVDSLPEYRLITRHSLASLRSILSIELGAFITLRDLLDALHANECEYCGKPAAYIYLLTCGRVCFDCLSTKKEYGPLVVEETEMYFGFPRALLEGLPTMKSVPGRFGFDDHSHVRRRNLVDSLRAYNIGLAYHAERKTDHRRRVLPPSAKRPPLRIRPADVHARRAFLRKLVLGHLVLVVNRRPKARLDDNIDDQ